MKARSLSVFRTKLHRDDPGTVLVNIGDVIAGDDDHLRALARNRLVELLEGETPHVGGDTKSESVAPSGKAEPKAKAKPRPATKPAKPVTIKKPKPVSKPEGEAKEAPPATEAQPGNIVDGKELPTASEIEEKAE